jgi:hypothetical protein
VRELASHPRDAAPAAVVSATPRDLTSSPSPARQAGYLLPPQVPFSLTTPASALSTSSRTLYYSFGISTSSISTSCSSLSHPKLISMRGCGPRMSSTCSAARMGSISHFVKTGHSWRSPSCTTVAAAPWSTSAQETARSVGSP